MVHSLLALPLLSDDVCNFAPSAASPGPSSSSSSSSLFFTTARTRLASSRCPS